MLNRKKLWEIVIVCVLFLAMAGYVEKTGSNINKNDQIIRASPGSRSEEITLEVNAKDLLTDYKYEVRVPATGITQKEAEAYFEQAKEEIDRTFYAPGDSAQQVCHSVTMQEEYADHLVEAEWTLDHYRYMDGKGNLLEDHLREDDVSQQMVQARAELTCGEYKQEYIFSFMVMLPTRSQKEQLLADIDRAVEEEGRKEGENYFQLPQQVDGVDLEWKEPRQHLLVKVLFFEIVIVVLLYFVMQEKQRTKEKERKQQMELDYAEFVNKVLILLGSGMSLKQSLHRISAQYLDKRQKNQTKERYLYEELLVTDRQMQDGESERRAYQKFGERTGLSCYHRLVRILIQNLQTGNRGLCALLDQEAQTALEERKALARKLGEEATTKMLLPLMMMLGIVIAIIMVPAMQSFGI